MCLNWQTETKDENEDNDNALRMVSVAIISILAGFPGVGSWEWRTDNDDNEEYFANESIFETLNKSNIFFFNIILAEYQFMVKIANRTLFTTSLS